MNGLNPTRSHTPFPLMLLVMIVLSKVLLKRKNHFVPLFSLRIMPDPPHAENPRIDNLHPELHNTHPDLT